MRAGIYVALGATIVLAVAFVFWAFVLPDAAKADPAPQPTVAPRMLHIAGGTVPHVSSEYLNVDSTVAWHILRDEKTDWEYLVVERYHGGVAVIPLAPEGDWMPDPEDQPISVVVH